MTQPDTVDVLIPAYNEAAALPLLLAEIPRHAVRRILVVDNASTDATAELARAAGCHVVHSPQRGYGNACLDGLAYLRNDPPTVVVFLDGDRSDFPHYLIDLATPILQDQADFVLGSRRLGKAQSGSLTLPQRFGNALATRLMRLFWGTPYTDLGPFRAIRWTALERLHMADRNYGWTIEMQIKAFLAGLRIQELPIDYRCRIGQSKISGTIKGVLGAGSKILWTLFSFWLRSARARTHLTETRL